MRRELAEKLLATIMEWDDDVKATQRAALEAFANYKYDEYQQFAPGRRFLESLALWLRQFGTLEEREVAYDFVRTRLIFVSDAEMNNLVELAFQTYVRPHLVDMTATRTGLPGYRVKSIVDSLEYKMNLRRTLVLGLSDGARTDQFRRANPFTISNEQIWPAYDISAAKAADLLKDLKKDLGLINPWPGESVDPVFQTVVLLDDFTASGTSYLRQTDGGWNGKIHKILDKLSDEEDGLGSLVAKENVTVIVILYVAAQQAIEYILPLLAERGFDRGNIQFEVVHKLSENTRLNEDKDKGILGLVGNNDYWDDDVDDEHAKVGGASFRSGYADCQLPVVLNHNTPNNSIYLLWAEEINNVHGLFPRVSRHRKSE